MSQRSYRNFLTIGEGGKAIPYGGFGVVREDGEANYGFRDLKGRPERLADIPELVRDPALRELVEAINSAHSPLFSIGCASGAVEQEQGFGRSGYIEFAWDADVAVTDAQSYFPPFFHFNRFLREIDFSKPASFQWEISGAHFGRAGTGKTGLNGFTATIWIKVGLATSGEEASKAWHATLTALAHFLSRQAPREGDAICPLPDAASAA